VPTTKEADVADSNLEPRKIPRQRRSREQVEKILSATRAILQEKGAAAVTAVTIAREAGVSVGSFYQYFPNKKAVLIALYHAYLDELHASVEHFESAKYRTLGWREFFTEVIQFVKRQEMLGPEVRELANAMRMYPEMQAIDQERGQAGVDFWVRHMTRLGARGTRRHLEQISWFLQELNNGIWAYQMRDEISRASLRLINEWEATAILAVVATVFPEDSVNPTSKH
jgi:AcrR family transcriptional regulator